MANSDYFSSDLMNVDASVESCRKAESCVRQRKEQEAKEIPGVGISSQHLVVNAT